MRYLFEDGDDSILLKFIRKGYENPKIIEGTSGVGLIKTYVKNIGKDEQIFIFMDLVPDNKVTCAEYEILKSMKNDGYNIIVFPVPCTEYFFIQTLVQLNMIEMTKEVRECLRRGVITNLTINGETAKNYERFCKKILHNMPIDCARLDGESPKFGLFYTEDCKCSSAELDCKEFSLKDKVKELLQCYPCIPSGSIYEVTKLTFDECIKIHRELVDDYNRAVKRYKDRNPELSEKYIEVLYMY